MKIFKFFLLINCLLFKGSLALKKILSHNLYYGSYKTLKEVFKARKKLVLYTYGLLMNKCYHPFFIYNPSINKLV